MARSSSPDIPGEHVEIAYRVVSYATDILQKDFAHPVGAVKAPTMSEEPNMQAVTTIGLDIAKSVFQIHGVDAVGNVIVRRQLKRRYVLPFFQKLSPCLVGIEANCRLLVIRCA